MFYMVFVFRSFRKCLRKHPWHRSNFRKKDLTWVSSWSSCDIFQSKFTFSEWLWMNLIFILRYELSHLLQLFKIGRWLLQISWVPIHHGDSCWSREFFKYMWGFSVLSLNWGHLRFSADFRRILMKTDISLAIFDSFVVVMCCPNVLS